MARVDWQARNRKARSMRAGTAKRRKKKSKAEGILSQKMKGNNRNLNSVYRQHRCAGATKSAADSCKEVAMTIEVKASLYADRSLWTDTGLSIQGWPTFEVVSAHSGKKYTLCLSPRKGEYVCNCQSPRDCWHLYAFRENFLPMIRASRDAVSLADTMPRSVAPVRLADRSVMSAADFDGPAAPPLAFTPWTPTTEHTYGRLAG